MAKITPVFSVCSLLNIVAISVASARSSSREESPKRRLKLATEAAD